MPNTSKDILIDILGCKYKIPLNYKTVSDIESEMGGLMKILDSFQKCQWTVSDVVHLLHIMISHTGETPDFEDLGNAVVEKGASYYMDPIMKFLLAAVIGIPRHTDKDKAA